MAVQYVVTQVEMEALISSLELANLRAKDRLPKGSDEWVKLDELHRTFHYYVVQWAQGVGYRLR